MDLAGPLSLFFGTAIVVVVAARFLAASGVVIAFRTGWGQVWVGTLLLAGATSLPELVASSTAAFLGKPDLAGGNIFGSNMLNVTILALALGFFGGKQVFQRVLPQQTWVAALAIVLTVTAVVLAAIQLDARWLVISPASLIIIALYIWGSRLLFKQSSNAVQPEIATNSRSLRWGWTVFALSSGAIFAASVFLTTSAVDIADITGISESFIGVLAVAFVTSLPEVSTSVAALRIGAPNLAVSNIYGSNAFNIVALAVADLFFTGGSLFGNLGNGAVVAGLFAILLMVLGTLQLLLRRPLKPFSLTEPSALGIVAIYAIGLVLVYRIG